jgi:cysteine-rich repeat protein
MPVFVRIGCGNGVVDANESCDDGNLVSTDGCDALCADVNECLSSPPCKANSACVNLVGGYACACREAAEEFGATLTPSDLHFTGLVSEYGYQGQTHWLMFLFECRRPLPGLPTAIDEGKFGFFSRDEINRIAIPETDRTLLWPVYDEHRRGFIAYRAECHPGAPLQVVVEETQDRPHLD